MLHCPEATGGAAPVLRLFGGAEGPDELLTWQQTFDRCELAAFDAGRKLAFRRHVADVDDFCLIENAQARLAEKYVRGVQEKIVQRRIWEFTRKLVIEPLLPAALARIRDQFTLGFYSAADVSSLGTAGRC